ncbi:MAG: DUF2892 domain-containing protein [Armatimonadetes bacterium]|nr:DUF2892 domain-containing protein [Armatimonadota bacterium]
MQTNTTDQPSLHTVRSCDLKGVMWSLDRQSRIGAGLLTLTGVILGFLVHPGWFGLSAFVGVGLLFAGVTDICGLSYLMALMPWNRRVVPKG